MGRHKAVEASPGSGAGEAGPGVSATAEGGPGAEGVQAEHIGNEEAVRRTTLKPITLIYSYQTLVAALTALTGAAPRDRDFHGVERRSL
jgi:hypothetical protein